MRRKNKPVRTFVYLLHFDKPISDLLEIAAAVRSSSPASTLKFSAPNVRQKK